MCCFPLTNAGCHLGHTEPTAKDLAGQQLFIARVCDHRDCSAPPTCFLIVDCQTCPHGQRTAEVCFSCDEHRDARADRLAEKIRMIVFILSGYTPTDRRVLAMDVKPNAIIGHLQVSAWVDTLRKGAAT